MSGLDRNRLSEDAKRLTTNRHFVILGLVLILLVGWNYWLPMAEDYFNMQTKPDRPPNVDFLVFYTAGGRFWSAANPYYWTNTDPQAQDFSDYIYPPTFLPFYLQLSKLNYESARHVWLALYSILYFATLMAFFFTIEKETRPTFLVLGFALTIVSYPLLSHIRIGQSDVLVSSISLLGFVCYTRNQKLFSAMLFAFATLAKVSPILFLIYFVIFLRDYRFLLFFGLAAGVLFLLSLISVPIELYADYFLNILPFVSGGTSYWHNQSILKFFASNMPLARLVSSLGFTLFLAFAWFLRRRSSTIERTPELLLGAKRFKSEALFLMNLLVMLIFVGKAWSMAYVWTILPSALLLTHLLHAKSKNWFLVVVSIAIFLLSSKVYGFPVLDSLNLLGNVTLTSCLVILLVKQEWAMVEQVQIS